MNMQKIESPFGDYSVNIVPKKSITVQRDGHNPTTFHIGDIAEYDSYNLSYTGVILSITEKTVTIETYSGTQSARKHRLKISQFAWRNYNFNAEKTAKENFETMMYI